jgi:hypothetical protein
VGLCSSAVAEFWSVVTDPSASGRPSTIASSVQTIASSVQRCRSGIVEAIVEGRVDGDIRICAAAEVPLVGEAERWCGAAGYLGVRSIFAGALMRRESFVGCCSVH